MFNLSSSMSDRINFDQFVSIQIEETFDHLTPQEIAECRAENYISVIPLNDDYEEAFARFTSIFKKTMLEKILPDECVFVTSKMPKQDFLRLFVNEENKAYKVQLVLKNARVGLANIIYMTNQFFIPESFGKHSNLAKQKRE